MFEAELCQGKCLRSSRRSLNCQIYVPTVKASKGAEEHTMTKDFSDHMRIFQDLRIPGTLTFPLEEILLSTTAGVVYGADDWDSIEAVATGGARLASELLAFRARHCDGADLAEGSSACSNLCAGRTAPALRRRQWSRATWPGRRALCEQNSRRTRLCALRARGDRHAPSTSLRARSKVLRGSS